MVLLLLAVLCQHCGAHGVCVGAQSTCWCRQLGSSWQLISMIEELEAEHVPSIYVCTLMAGVLMYSWPPFALSGSMLSWQVCMCCVPKNG
jgi:hypothetical protein